MPEPEIVAELMKKIPIEFKSLSYVIEDIYHGRKTWWLLDWLNYELQDQVIENAKEYVIETDVIEQLHQTCCEIIEHRDRLTSESSVMRSCI